MSPMNKPCASTLEPFRSSSPVLPAVPPLRLFHVISASRFGRIVTLAIALAPLPLATLGATPAPHSNGKSPVRVDVTKVQPKAMLPKHAEHAEYLVEINKLGQVTKIKGGRGSDNPTFNAQTYGNALQSFIRTPDGHVVLGTYRLTYDYDPKTERVRRDVGLVRQGGVDPDAKGAALGLMQKAEADARKAPAQAPAPRETIDPHSLPDLPSVSAPTPSPHR